MIELAGQVIGGLLVLPVLATFGIVGLVEVFKRLAA